MTGRAEADLDAKELTDAVSRRPADRRPFGDRRVAEETLRRLVETEGAYLHVVPDDRVAEPAISVDEAADTEYFDPGVPIRADPLDEPAGVERGRRAAGHRRGALRAPCAGAHLPSRRLVGPARGRRPRRGHGVRDHVRDRRHARRSAGRWGGDVGAVAGNDRRGRVHRPVSEAVEVAWPRRLLRRLLSETGEPYLIVRLGYVDFCEVLPGSPRRAASETIRIDE
jgi:hypothetical protein